MKTKWKALLIMFIIICINLLSGCWNYREVEQLAIVSGVAIDSLGKDKVLVTVEIIGIEQGEPQSTLKPVYIHAVGKTFFDAVRAMIAIQGKRMYWSHAKVIIVSEDIAKESIVEVLDFINRDAEVREDMWVLLSREKTARDIFNSKPIFESLVSFELDDTMRAQGSISRYPSIELYRFLDNIASKETSTTIPTVKLIDIKGITVSYVTGAAVIKKDKLQGYLDEAETRSLLWILDEIKGGVYSVENVADTQLNATLEIFRSKTKIKPEVKAGVPTFKVSIVIDCNVGEIMGSKDFISEKNVGVLEKDAEAQIKQDIEKLIDKAQKNYKTDFLGFGENMKRAMPNAWRSIANEWNDMFQDIEVKVEVDVRVKGSATTRKPIKVGM